MDVCKKCGKPVQNGQELCYDHSPSGYSCSFCRRSLTNGRVEILKEIDPDGEMVCEEHSHSGSQKVVADAGWNGHSYSTANSRFHKGRHTSTGRTDAEGTMEKDIAMTTRELIQAEIANVPEEKLDELYRLVQRFATAETPPSGSIMAKLREIRIEAPADFATNLDLYMSGEKNGGQDVP